MFMKATLPGFTMSVNAPGWEALRTTAKIRNRLTHPRSSKEMDVIDEELEAVHQAFIWVSHSTVTAVARAVEILRQETGEEIPERLDAVRRRWAPSSRDNAHST